MQTRHRQALRLTATLASPALLALCLSTLDPPDVRACGASPCAPPRVIPAGGDIPSDRLTFSYAPGRETAGTDEDGALPRLYRLEDGGRTEVPLELQPVAVVGPGWQLIPRSPPAVGSKLVLEGAAPSCHADWSLAAQFTVTAPAPLPSDLGALEVMVQSGSLKVAEYSGGCDRVVDASYADLTLLPSPSALPYKDLFDYTLVVDGKDAAGFSSSSIIESRLDGGVPLPQGTERIFALCRALPGNPNVDDVQLGAHRVKLRAKLDGVTLETPEVQVDLRCDGGTMSSGKGDLRDANVATSSDAAGEPDPHDAHTKPSDAGVRGPSDSGVRSTSSASTADATNTSEGGCSLARGGQSGAPSAWLLGVLAISVARRRRR